MNYLSEEFEKSEEFESLVEDSQEGKIAGRP